MLEFHQGKTECIATMMGTEATRQQSVNFGCIVEDRTTHREPDTASTINKNSQRKRESRD